MQTHPRLTLLKAPTPTPRQAWQEAIDGFLRRAEGRNLSPHTLLFYRERLARWAAYLEERAPTVGPAEVTPAVVRDFLTSERERCSPSAAAHARTALSAFFRHLVAEEVIAENPMDKVERVRLPRKLVATLTEEQVQALLAQGSPRTFAGTRLRALVLALVDCGLRASELCGLDLGDVDWNAGTLKVMGKGAKERAVPFGEATRQALLAYLAKRGDVPRQPALFVTCYRERLTRHELHRVLKEAGERAGIPGLHPHQLRHTCAVMYLRNGGDAFTLQRLLGHSSLEMTRRYCELAQGDLVARHRQASPGDRFADCVRPTSGRRRLR